MSSGLTTLTAEQYLQKTYTLLEDLGQETILSKTEKILTLETTVGRNVLSLR